jgi:N-acetylglucosamine malate deacetylase 1
MSLFELSPRRAVVVAPHADDEVLGAGGLIARLCNDGWDVRVLYGVVSGFESNSGADSTTSARQQELDAALSVLAGASRKIGYEVLFVGEKEHLRLDTVAQSDLISFVEAALETHRPSLVVIPSLGDHHQDHRAIAQACLAALRPAPEGRLPLVQLVLGYGRSGAAGWGGEAYRFHPNTFVDISEVIDQKIGSMSRYASQLKEPPHPRSLEGMRSRAATYGGLAGCAYAEGFECLRHVV